MKMAKLVLISLTALTFIITACERSSSVANNSARPAATPPAAAPANSQTNAAQASTSTDGKELFATKCTICHKDTGKGGPVTVAGKNLKPADLTSAKMKSRTDEKLADMIAEGDPEEGMPAFKEKLAADQIKAIVQYVKTLP